MHLAKHLYIIFEISVLVLCRRKPQRRILFWLQPRKKNILLWPQTIFKEHIWKPKTIALPSRGASEWMNDRNQKHVGLDQLYLQNRFDLNTKKNSSFGNFKNMLKPPPHPSLYQTKTTPTHHTHDISLPWKRCNVQLSRNASIRGPWLSQNTSLITKGFLFFIF